MSEDLTLKEVRALAFKARKKYRLKRRVTRLIVGIPLIALAYYLIGSTDIKTVLAFFSFYIGLTVVCL